MHYWALDTLFSSCYIMLIVVKMRNCQLNIIFFFFRMESFSLGLVFVTSLVLQKIMIIQTKSILRTYQTQNGSVYLSREWKFMVGWSMAQSFSTVNMKSLKSMTNRNLVTLHKSGLYKINVLYII